MTGMGAWAGIAARDSEGPLWVDGSPSCIVRKSAAVGGLRSSGTGNLNRRSWIDSPAWLRLQLAFQLVEETPIGILRDNLLRTRLDKAHVTQSQGIEPDRVFSVVFAPFVVTIFS